MQTQMMQTIEAIAYHGWGYDHTCWQDWQTAFGDRHISFAAFDRGYFGRPSVPEFSDEAFKVLLVHSYGLHLCPVAQLQKADVLVILSSFLTFHPQEERAKRRSQRVLQRMIEGFKANPGEVLSAFKINSDDPTSTIPEHLNHSLLLTDLENLGVSQLDPQPLLSIPTIMILHGTGDRIVPVSQAQDLVGQLAPHSTYVEMADAGHALPFTHPIQCWDIVRAHLPLLHDGG